jgi:transcriptional regulator with XRE-family HTH domain
MQHLGARLRALREARALTTVDAGAQTGLARRTIYRAEQGQNPTLLTIVRLLRLYGRLDALAAFLPEPELSPMRLLEAQRQRRKGAERKPEREKPGRMGPGQKAGRRKPGRLGPGRPASARKVRRRAPAPDASRG